jgi:hypothetical protein
MQYRLAERLAQLRTARASWASLELPSVTYHLARIDAEMREVAAYIIAGGNYGWDD